MIEETFSARPNFGNEFAPESAQQSDKFVVNLQEYEMKLTSNWQLKFISEGGAEKQGQRRRNREGWLDGRAKALLIRTHPLPGDPVPSSANFSRMFGQGPI